MIDQTSRLTHRFDSNLLSYAEYSVRGTLRGVIWLLCMCAFLVFNRF